METERRSSKLLPDDVEISVTEAARELKYKHFSWSVPLRSIRLNYT